MRFFLIGRDIEWSLSPQIHKIIYDIMGVRAEYGLMQMDNIADFARLDLRSYDGFNITTPFKSSIIKYIDKDFSNCGSINTIRIENHTQLNNCSTVQQSNCTKCCKNTAIETQNSTKGQKNYHQLNDCSTVQQSNRTKCCKNTAIEAQNITKCQENYHQLNGCSTVQPKVCGYSTDGKGFVLDAKRLNLDLSRVLLVGFGGAAKSISHQLICNNSQVFAINRDKIADIKSVKKQKKITLTVNCSGENIDECDYDLRYNSILNSKRSGINDNINGSISGIGMLIYQAILSAQIFLKIPIETAIYSEIYKVLGQKT